MLGLDPNCASRYLNDSHAQLRGLSMFTSEQRPAGLASTVEEAARHPLAAIPRDTRHLKRIAVHDHEGVFTLRGQLPTYYLKQLLQAYLRKVPDVTRVENQVDVVGSSAEMNPQPFKMRTKNKSIDCRMSLRIDLNHLPRIEGVHGSAFVVSFAPARKTVSQSKDQ